MKNVFLLSLDLQNNTIDCSPLEVDPLQEINIEKTICKENIWKIASVDISQYFWCPERGFFIYFISETTLTQSIFINVVGWVFFFFRIVHVLELGNFFFFYVWDIF